VLLLDQVVARTEGDEVRIVGGGRDRHRPGAADVRVAELEAYKTGVLEGGGASRNFACKSRQDHSWCSIG
jgi:hypothetical protein